MNEFAITFYFKQIFPTYDEWEEFTVKEKIYIVNAFNTEFNQYLYKVFYQNFYLENINYVNKYTFKRQLSFRLLDTFDFFNTRKKQLIKMLELTDTEIREISKAITRSSERPVKMSDTNNDSLEYVDNQQINESIVNKLQAFSEHIRTIKTLGGKEIYNKYKDMFFSTNANKIYNY